MDPLPDRFPGRGCRTCILALALTLTAGSAGCHSMGPPVAGPQVLRPGQAANYSALELTSKERKVIEAHAHFLAARLEEYADSPQTALVHYLAAVEKDPTDEGLTLETARRLVEQRRLNEARRLLERATARRQSSGIVWGYLGVVHSLQTNRAAARTAHREALRRMPDDMGAYQELARLYLSAGLVSEALVVLEQAAARPDADASFLIMLAEALGALRQLRDPGVGDLKPRVLKLLDRAAALEPTDPDELMRLADLYQVFGDGTKALPLYQRILESGSDLPGLRERLAEIYLRTDNAERAMEQLRVLASRQPTNPLPHYFLGVLALEMKRFDEAVDAFNRVLILRPDNEAIHFELALAHLSHRRPEDALKILERARARFRTSFRVEFFTGLALLDLKRYDDAIRAMTAAEVVAGATSPTDLTPTFYFQSGVACERAKRFEDAAVQFEKALELDPDFAEALNYLGYMWAEQGVNLDRARKLIERAVKLEPDNEAFLDSLAWVLHQLGRSEEALPHQLRAVELAKEPDATLYDHLGDIYRRLDRLDDARKAWRRAQELEPSPAIQQKLDETGRP